MAISLRSNSGFFVANSRVVIPTSQVILGMRSANGRMTRNFCGSKRQDRIDQRRRLNGARRQGGEAGTKAARRHGFDLVGHLRRVERQMQQHIAGRFRRRVTGLLAGEVGHFMDVGFWIGDERNLADMAAGRIDDDDIQSGPSRGDRGRGRHLAVRQIAGQHIAQCGAAAGAGDHFIDLDAGFVEKSLFHGDRPRQRRGHAAVLADRELVGVGRRRNGR